ncbi:hypothetical protein OAD74_07655 [Alphaproteobacteria bacterium]|nr:hypothetical protein [Alphaproteobacteria bacterium]
MEATFQWMPFLTRKKALVIRLQALEHLIMVMSPQLIFLADNGTNSSELVAHRLYGKMQPLLTMEIGSLKKSTQKNDERPHSNLKKY